MVRVLDRLTAPRAPSDSIPKHRVEEFRGTSMEESDKAEFWLEKLERALDEARCPIDQKITCAVSLLQGAAYDWWKLVLRNPLLPDPITWDYFVTEFNKKYVTDDYKESKWKIFLTLRQGKMTVAEYEKEFNRLSKYAPESVLTEKFRCGQFEDGLHESIKRYLMAVTSLQAINIYHLVQAVIKIKKSEMKSQEIKKEKKFSRRGSSLGKDLESHMLIQYRVQLQGVGDKDLPLHKVSVEASQLDKRKSMNARTATNIIVVFADE